MTTPALKATYPDIDPLIDACRFAPYTMEKE